MFKSTSTFLIFTALLLFISCGSDDTTTTPTFDAEVSISTASNSVNESIGTVTITVSLNKTNSTQEAIVIGYELSGSASAGSDYSGGSTTIEIAAGSNSVTFILTIIDDADIEADETIIVTLNGSQPTGISISIMNSVTTTISDNDGNSGIGDADCPNDNTLSFTNIGCDTEPTTDSKYVETVSGSKRTMAVNSYPNHSYSTKDVLTETNSTFEVTTNPAKASTSTSILGDTGHPARYYGVALNGVIIAPAPATPFIFENTNTGEYNWDWVFEPTNNQGNGMDKVALDCASAHQGPQGYHYHGNMFTYAETLQSGLSTGTTPTTPVQMGWASDGFPILYLYGPDASGALKKLQPSYQLISGNRTGDGVSAPCGSYNGKYTNDYEFMAGLGDLDACNGVERNITLTTEQGQETFSYFYMVTENFPQISRCLTGTPDASFEN